VDTSLISEVDISFSHRLFLPHPPRHQQHHGTPYRNLDRHRTGFIRL